ncbi:DUF192 domain-containing protein [Candidatus Omnitrophota bacterium]
MGLRLGSLFAYEKKWIIATSAVVIALTIVLTMWRGAAAERHTICFGSDCFEVELAVTPQERISGLMHRRRLSANRGMLFLFEDEFPHGFWMKNTYIPLDIIWLDRDKEIVFIERNVQPCFSDKCQSIVPDVKAMYVLELNAGVANNIGLSEGDRAQF